MHGAHKNGIIPSVYGRGEDSGTLVLNNRICRVKRSSSLFRKTDRYKRGTQDTYQND